MFTVDRAFPLTDLVQIRTVLQTAPGIFTFNGSGCGWANLNILRVNNITQEQI
jgi:hypothetical protein